MPVTAKDVAGKLGLSQPTVSRILSGERGYRVAPETRRRVLEAAQQMGYRPNAVARSLRRRRTNIVGFYTGYGYLDARNAYLAALLGGLQQACDAQKLDILLHGVFRGRSTDDIYGELIDGRIDGLFLHTVAEDPLVARLAGSHLPVVALSDALPGLPSVCADDCDGARQAVNFLWARGHRRIAYLAPQPRFTSVERRVKAFHREMESCGGEAVLIRIEMEDAGRGLEALLAMASPPTAACCWNDLSAANLLADCRTRGVRMPDDLAVIGFDGALDSRFMTQKLTTVAVPWDTLGQRALETLQAQLCGADVTRETDVPVHLVLGDTT